MTRPDPSLRFRIATEEDVPDLLHLLCQVAPENHAPGTLSPSQAASVLARMASYPCYAAWLCLRGHDPIGTFSLLIMESLGPGGAPTGVVENLVVLPEERRRGVGRAMVRHALALCRRRDCATMLLAGVTSSDASSFCAGLGVTPLGKCVSIDVAHDLDDRARAEDRSESFD